LGEGFQLRARAFRNQFHPSIGQVADGSDDFKTGRHRPRGIAKAYALNMSRIDDGQAVSVLSRNMRHGRDKAKADGRMQCFLVKLHNFFVLSLTRRVNCHKKKRLPFVSPTEG